MIDFNVDVAAVVVAGVGAAYLIGTIRQRIVDLECRLNNLDHRHIQENALLLDIRERVIAIEHYLNAKRVASVTPNYATGD